ncbi:MAG: nucleotidyltransferase domain-containing protein [Defluviitaleaceae bacterium]|nr:nucleotidyltransferase domain-containing protein [Defluviitaleaceae bacterium]
MRYVTRKFFDSFLRNIFPLEIKKIILFGSEAYGSPKVHSDIDIAVVIEGSYTKELFNLIDSLIEEAHPPCKYDLVFVNESGFLNNLDIRKDIFEKGKILYERNI